jgi:choice-of-anchor B domain-containing protein
MKKNYMLAAVLCALIYSSSFAQQLNIIQLGYLPYQLAPGTRISNIGGYVDAQGNEYALLGHPDGLSIVNVTDPVNPYQVFMVPTPSPGALNNTNNWREVKTMGNYAYVVTEAGGGLQIINLTDLPNNYQVKTWTGDGIINGLLGQIHALHVDDNHVYLYGTWAAANGGMVIADISDPWNPSYVGRYDQFYVHDGYVRADTVYAAQIYQGNIAIIDVSDKANPQVVNTIQTPTAFPHNTWLSDDSKTLFTTDENTGSYLASFDVSDKQNITGLDRIQSYAGDSSVVHNTHILNDYAVNSWYHDGVTIVDGARPANLLETAYFDLSPLTGPGFNGVWGVYPYLPSGNLIVSHRDSGLYILAPTYIRGAYLEGIITDSITGLPLANVKVEILSTTSTDNSKISGEYKTGTAIPGNYDVKLSRSGYHDKIINNINLTNGILTTLNVEMVPSTSSTDQILHPDFISIYPNPASNEIFIDIKSTIPVSVFIELYNSLGQVIKKSDFKLNAFENKIKFPLENIPSGIYHLKILERNNIVVKKLIVTD